MFAALHADCFDRAKLSQREKTQVQKVSAGMQVICFLFFICSMQIVLLRMTVTTYYFGLTLSCLLFTLCHRAS